MALPIQINLQIADIFGGRTQTFTFSEGMLTLVGPNGSGKTQALHALRPKLEQEVKGRKVRYLSPGRLASIEQHRSDITGQYAGEPRFDVTPVGSRHLISSRHYSSGIIGDVLALHQRPDLRIRVEARLQDLFQRRLALEWGQNGLQMEFTRTDGGASYAASREASGLLHLVSILAAAFDDEVGALLLDEPEVSLHPQLQAYVLRELRSVAGDPDDPRRKLVVVSTHSPTMLQVRRPEHLTRLIFFESTSVDPKQVNATAPELAAKSISGLLARMGESHRAAFFARRLLLVEGPSDELIAQALAVKLDLPLDAAGTQLVPVIGKGEMAAVRKLFALTGKDCVVLADLDAFVDDGKLVGEFYNVTAIEDDITAKGHRDLRAFSASVRDDLKREIQTHYADLAFVADAHPYWTSRETGADEHVARVRAGTACLLSMDSGKLNSLPNAAMWSALRTRTLSLLDALELGGCFVLRRGALESYSLSGGFAPGIRAKPEAAAVEADAILVANDGSLRDQMGDIVRALEYAAQRPRVDEVGQLRQLLLSALAPCLDSCTKGTPSLELNQRARAFLQDRAGIFNIENATVDDALPRLRVTLTSRILDGQKFPIEVTKDNLYAALTNALPSSAVDRAASPNGSVTPHG
jgi:predicted ATPase